MKKKILLLAICFLILTSNAFAELTQSDLQEIDKLIQASEDRIKEYVDLKINALDAKLTGQINALDGRLTQVYGFVIALVALTAVAVGLPQILVARQGKEMRAQDQRIEVLQQEIEKLKQERGSGPKM